MCDILRIQKCQHIRRRNAIIRTKGCPSRLDIVPVNINFKGLCQKIMLCILVFITDHINMPLHNQYRRAFIACCAALFNQNIHFIILTAVKPSFLCKRNNIITQSFFVKASMGDIADFFKIIKNFIATQMA